MKYRCETNIKLRRDQVVKLFMDDSKRHHWQDDFVKLVRKTENTWQQGAVTEYTYRHRAKVLILTETILENELPDYVSAKYEASQMTNTMKNEFIIIGEQETRWIAIVEYSYFKGLLKKTFLPMMRKKFVRQTQRWLDQFKSFAESENQ